MKRGKIIDRMFLADLAKEAGLNASHLETLGGRRNCKIAVEGNMLQRLIEIQQRFKRLVTN